MLQTTRHFKDLNSTPGCSGRLCNKDDYTQLLFQPDYTGQDHEQMYFIRAGFGGWIKLETAITAGLCPLLLLNLLTMWLHKTGETYFKEYVHGYVSEQAFLRTLK
jgi:hypothetical protein